MNRTIYFGFITSLLLLSFHPINPLLAQKFEGGLIAGLCASQVAGDTYSGYNKAGLFAGGYVALHISDRNALRLELDYIQKGSHKNSNPDIEDYDTYDMRLAYVEMPLLLRRSYGKKIIAEVGPAMSFLIHSYEAINKSEIYGGIPFKKQNLSFIAGISYLINDRISVGMRTNNSLFSIRDKNNDLHFRRRFGTYGQFNDVLVLNLSYKL
jgi:hypothetical protein